MKHIQNGKTNHHVDTSAHVKIWVYILSHKPLYDGRNTPDDVKEQTNDFPVDEIFLFDKFILVHARSSP
jgi:hypothetical protein